MGQSTYWTWAFACLAALVPASVSAEDLVVTDARIITGTGSVIGRGYLVIAGDRIVTVAPGRPPASVKGPRLDATGMTVIAGYIDGHRHLIPGSREMTPDARAAYFRDKAAPLMRDLIESGVTTVMSGGDDLAAVVQLKRMTDTGGMVGPRIITSGWVPTAQMASEADVRAAVDAAFKGGAESIAEVHYPTVPQPVNPTEKETRNLAAGIAEAGKLGIPFQVHAVSPDALVAAVRIGARRLVHSQHYNWLTDAQAREVAATGALVASSTAVPSPVFGVFNSTNAPAYRTGKAWPAGEPVLGEDRGRAIGYMPVNARTMYDNGVGFSYSSDTNYNATAGLAQELKTLNLVFSPADMVSLLGRNSAAFVNRPDRGTLEVGKLGDLLVLSGNPLDGYWNFLRPVIVVKGGRIVIDKRAQLRPVQSLSGE